MTTLTARRTLLTTAGLGLALTIAGCSGSDSGSGGTGGGRTTPSSPATTGGSTPSDSPSPSSSESSESSSTEPSSSQSSGGSAEQTTVKIGEKLSDPETEDTVEVVQAIRNFPSEEQAEEIEEGGEVVLLQVKVTPGQKFGGSVSEGSFKISWDGGKDFWNNKTRYVEDELAAADLEEFDRIARRDGGSKTGWIAFVVKEKADTYLIEYTRSAAKVIGQDKTIDEFSKQVEIPAA